VYILRVSGFSNIVVVDYSEYKISECVSIANHPAVFSSPAISKVTILRYLILSHIVLESELDTAARGFAENALLYSMMMRPSDAHRHR
jgi:hypothetical protein